jgi:leucine dehydrogenase
MFNHREYDGHERVVFARDEDCGLRAIVAPEAVFDTPAEIFAPCALGGILDDSTIPRPEVRAVCGGANNQLGEPHHAAALARRGITFVPDYLAGAGGVIDFHLESVDDQPEATLAAVERIRDITADLLARAGDAGETPLESAEAIVRARLRASKEASRP